MPGATIWKGSLHFGDTDVPVKLHAAIREERTSFHLLHRQDRMRLQQQMICAYEKIPVPHEAQAKGFEVEEGKFIIIDPIELEQTVPESSRMIDIHEFVRNTEIDPLYLDHVYRLEPDSDLSAADYGELAEVMQKMQVSGICTWNMRKRFYLGAVQAHGTALRLTTLRHADEVVSVQFLELPEVTLSR